MESLFVGILFVVLFFEYGGDVRDQLLVALKNHPRGLIKYFGAAAVLSLALTALPTLLVSLYMRSEGFFAYEIFEQRRHAFEILSANVFVNYMLLTVYLFLAALVWAAKAPWFVKAVALIVSAFFISLVTIFGISEGRYALLFGLLVFAAIMGLALYYWIKSNYSDKAKSWWFPLVAAVALILLPMLGSKYAVAVATNALSQMQVGGVDVELSPSLDFQQTDTISAYLVLRTPEFYYVRYAHDRDRLVIVSTDHVFIRYKGQRLAKGAGAG